jgi:hypothetical protein
MLPQTSNIAVPVRSRTCLDPNDHCASPFMPWGRIVGDGPPSRDTDTMDRGFAPVGYVAVGAENPVCHASMIWPEYPGIRPFEATLSSRFAHSPD